MEPQRNDPPAEQPQVEREDLRQLVKNVLHTDQESRKVGVEGDLFTLKDVNFELEWDYSLPTLVLHSYEDSNYENSSRVKTLPSFIKKFYESYPFKFNMDNLLFAGGSVSNILQQGRGDTDLDIFVYGLNKNEANERVRKLITDIETSYHKHLNKKKTKEQKEQQKEEDEDEDAEENEERYGFSIKQIRNRNCITIVIDERITIQIIIRLYHSISEILHGFDLGSSAVGFDGKQVYFTTLSKFAYERGCNVVDTTRRSTTYEMRLEKYLRRNFSIIMPFLDISKLTKNNFKYHLVEVCELPVLAFSYSNIQGNKIIVSSMFLTDKPNKSDYQVKDLDSYNTFYINLRNLLDNNPDFYYLNTYHNTDILDKGPFISKKKIIDFYDGLLKKVTANRGQINFKICASYLRNVDFKEMMAKSLEGGKVNTEYLQSIIEDQKTRALMQLETRGKLDHTRLPWRSDNPGSQLVGSFNPIMEEPIKWYGRFLLGYQEPAVVPEKKEEVKKDEVKEVKDNMPKTGNVKALRDRLENVVPTKKLEERKDVNFLDDENQIIISQTPVVKSKLTSKPARRTEPTTRRPLAGSGRPERKESNSDSDDEEPPKSKAKPASKAPATKKKSDRDESDDDDEDDQLKKRKRENQTEQRRSSDRNGSRRSSNSHDEYYDPDTPENVPRQRNQQPRRSFTGSERPVAGTRVTKLFNPTVGGRRSDRLQGRRNY
jgi:hypothetical protein